LRHRPAQLLGLGILLTAALVGAGVLPRVPAATPPGSRIAVVDLAAVVRAHPRWAEVDALDKRISRLQTQFAKLPPPPALPRTDIQRALDEEAARLRREFEKEFDFLRQESLRRLESFRAMVRDEHQTKFDATRKQLEADGQAAIEAKRKELEAQLRAAEQAIMAEYTYPLLNLRLRAEVAGLSSEQEGRAILREIQTLQAEREERVHASDDEFDKMLMEFQKTIEVEGNAKLDALSATLEQEARERILAKGKELDDELKRTLAEKDAQFRARLTRRQKELIAAADAQVRIQQRAYLSGLDARTKQARAELAAVQAERERLDASMLADVKITVAAIAQAQKLDVVLTRYIANVGGQNITAAVIQRMKR